jgi:membrane associated rhomboid family serine protease
MLPLGDEESRPGSAAPVVAALIALNVAVFVAESMMAPDDLDAAMRRYAVVPDLLLSTPATYWPSLFTSMFLHASWLHLLGNMLFLYIFADNIEDLLGSVPFLVFYVLCGLAAMAAQVAMDPHSGVAIVGASGAISGVLGAYVTAFPRNRVKCLYWLAFFVGIIWVPAGVFLGLWFVMQLLFALSSHPGEGGGVAFAAHVGGFLCGMLLHRLFPKRRDALDYYDWRTSG